MISTPKPISTAKAPKAIGPYSQAVQVETNRMAPGLASAFVFCSGQIPLEPGTGEMVAGDIGAQTERVMENLKAVLDAAGTGLSHAVKTTVYLVDLADFGKMNEVYGRYFAEGAAPARATVQVSALPRGARVEIDCIAVVP
jgi:2-iminobutanoate/2-iminopropanoate deaminase